MVPDDLYIGKVIGKVDAIDLDSGNNGFVEYIVINKDKEMPFDINHTTGEVCFTGNFVES